MRKTIFFLLGLIITCNIVSAQQKDSAYASVRYSFTHLDDTTQPGNPYKANMVLYLGKELSLYTDYDKMMRIAKGGTQSARSGDGMIIVSGGRIGGPPPPPLSPLLSSVGNFYKDNKASKTFMLEAGGITVFAVEEKMPVIDWVITKDTKEILGMHCQKATADFKGRSYTAWFASEIPVSNGPWKLGGLPGLILEAYDTRKEVVFTLVSYENDIAPKILIEIPEKALKTSPKEMKRYQGAIDNDRNAAMGPSSGSINTSGGAVKIKQLNNPLEKEL